MGIVGLDDRTLELYLTDGAISQPVKDALTKIAGMRREVAQAQHEIETHQADYERISKDQVRERENLASADKSSVLYQRLQTKLFDQENQVDALLKQLDVLRATLEDKTKALNDFIATLTLP